VDRRLQEAGLFGRVARKKRRYSASEKQKRLSFANGYANWTVDDWKKVLFSDEKCFFGYGSQNGVTYVRREQGEQHALADEHLHHRVAHPVKVNVWACFAHSGTGYCHIFNETLDKQLAKRILQDNLMASHDLLMPSVQPQQWFFLHDNDPKFKSHVVQKFLHDTGITQIQFPPYSPDLNPIENLWARCQRRVDEYKADALEKLQDAVSDVWEALEPDIMQKLAESMPTRCQLVIEKQGGHTGY
jgi:hypothetical protein